MISDDQLFLLAPDVTSPSPLTFFKITFGGLSADWGNIMPCSSVSCSASNSESLLSADKTKIYSLFAYDYTPIYISFVTFNSDDGRIVDISYKLTTGCSSAKVNGSVLKGDYIAATLVWGSNKYVMRYNTVTFVFNTKKFMGTLYGWGLENTTGR